MVQFFLCDHIYIGLGLHLANHSQWVEILFEGVYSHLSNKRGGWNKRGGGAKFAKSLNVEVGINVEGGILWKKLMHNSNKHGKKSKEAIKVDSGFFQNR